MNMAENVSLIEKQSSLNLLINNKTEKFALKTSIESLAIHLQSV